MDFKTLEDYIVRRIQTLEGQVEKLKAEKAKAEGERDAAASLATWLLSKYEAKETDTGVQFFAARNVYKDYDRDEFVRIRDAKEAADEQ